jgi:hypothetical protein
VDEDVIGTSIGAVVEMMGIGNPPGPCCWPISFVESLEYSLRSETTDSDNGESELPFLSFDQLRLASDSDVGREGIEGDSFWA